MKKLSQHGLDFLKAASDLVIHQQALLDKIENTLGQDPYHYWVRRGAEIKEQCGATAEGEWEWFFHGLEVDIINCRDGRKLRVDFGPGGRRDAFTAYGVAEFIKKSRPPWREFNSLRRYLTTSYFRLIKTELNMQRLSRLENALLKRGLLKLADSRMSQLVTRYTRIDSHGMSAIEVPEELQPEDGNDLLLCNRLIISEAGREILQLAP